MDNLKIPFSIARLIFLEIRNEISDNQKKELQDWLSASKHNEVLYKRIVSEKSILEKINAYEQYDKTVAWDNIEEKLNRGNQTKKINLFKIVRYAAAILIPLFVGGYFILRNMKSELELASNTIVPGSQQAVLTLCSGEKIELNKSTIDKTFSQKSVRVVNKGNKLVYKIDKKPEEEVQKIIYNTLSTPLGGEYSLELTDGTRVWLNAGSSLTYPIDFEDTVRSVFVSGEAFFEVAKDAEKPFIVNTGEIKVRVLGTSFNIMAYKEEPIIATTLVEGKVSLSSAQGTGSSSSKAELLPGSQGVFNKSEKTILTHTVDTWTYTAWKDGQFIIDNETLVSLMKRLGRWYNFETEFESLELENYHFSGSLERYDDFETVMDMIELTTLISFQIKGNKVFVTKEE